MATAEACRILNHLESWGRIRVEPWWHHEHRALCYVNEPFNDLATESLWRDKGFQQAVFTGDLYDMRSEAPCWIEPFRSHTKVHNFSWSIYRMRPGRVLPTHRDTYARFRQIYNIADVNTVIRFVFFLEDWQSGHYFEIQKTPILQWKAGDGVYWIGATEHMAANLGESDRFTVQITGVL